MNEPDYNHIDCGQEGMFVLDTRPAVDLSEHIQGAPEHDCQQCGHYWGRDESARAGVVQHVLLAASSADYLAHIAVHNYDYPTDQKVIDYYSEVKSLTSLKKQHSDDQVHRDVLLDEWWQWASAIWRVSISGFLVVILTTVLAHFQQTDFF
ncbi:hypothetical protein MRB53_040500 [Persea americana]|nr:hypothetical protein MRB53_040500 [Persea americana]